MTDPLEAFPDFVAAVRARLEQGREAYGDRSFDRPVGELLDEIREELLDVCGWAYVTLQRIERLETAAGGRARIQKGEAIRAVVRRKLQELEGERAAEGAGQAQSEPEPYVDAFCGLPVTAAQRAELQRLAGAEGGVSRELVLRVKASSPERASR